MAEKEKEGVYSCFQGDISHLEYEKHPGDAEGDEGQLHEGENPGLSKFYDYYQKLVGWSEGFREYEGAALKVDKHQIQTSR